LGDEETRLQVGKPRGHDQIVGRKLQPHAAHPLDEGQILLGKRKHRDARKVHLLVARQMQQKIERAFKTFDIDGKYGLGEASLGPLVGPQPVHGNGFSRPLRLRCMLSLSHCRLAPFFRPRSPPTARTSRAPPLPRWCPPHAEPRALAQHVPKTCPTIPAFLWRPRASRPSSRCNEERDRSPPQGLPLRGPNNPQKAPSWTRHR